MHAAALTGHHRIRFSPEATAYANCARRYTHSKEHA